MKSSLKALLHGAIDYAGTFPPARLELAEAVASYERYRRSEHSWMLGNFVIPGERLDELPPALLKAGATSVFPLSVVLTSFGAEGVAAAGLPLSLTRMATLEFPPTLPPGLIERLRAPVFPGVDAFFEVAPGSDAHARLDAIAASSRFAKIRTGGITPDGFPSPESVYRLFRACADRAIRCKATAGLHHAVTGRYALTYDAGSATTTMYGFLNVLIAAALVRAGATEDETVAALQETSPAAFAFEDAGVAYRGRELTTADLASMRRDLLRSFGSCSFEEPIDDLKRMNLL